MARLLHAGIVRCDVSLENEHQELLERLKIDAYERAKERQSRYDYLIRKNNGHMVVWDSSRYRHYCDACGVTNYNHLIQLTTCIYGEA